MEKEFLKSICYFLSSVIRNMEKYLYILIFSVDNSVEKKHTASICKEALVSFKYVKVARTVDDIFKVILNLKSIDLKNN